MAKERYDLVVVTWKQLGVAERSAFDDFIQPLIVAGKFDVDREVGTVFDEILGDGEAPVGEMGCGVEDGRLTTDAGFVYGSPSVYVCAAFNEKLGGFKVAVFCRNVQQGCATESEAASAG